MIQSARTRAALVLSIAVWLAVLPAAAQSSHPASRYYSAFPSEAVVLDVNDTTRDLTTPVELPLLPRSVLTSSFGTLEGPLQTILGTVEAVAVDRNGRLFILDSRFNNVRVIADDGRFLQSFGSPGNGPGELARPTSIAVDAGGHVYVADASRAVQVFALDRSGTYRYTRAFRLPAAAHGMCFLGSDLFIHGSNLEVANLIHRVDTTGVVLNSFGSLYSSPVPFINYTLSRSYIACDAHSGTIVLAPRGGLAEVRAYRRDGTPAWRLKLHGYVSASVEERGRAVRVTTLPGGSFIMALVTAPGGFVLQIGTRTQLGQVVIDGDGLTRLFFLAAGSGRPAALGRGPNETFRWIGRSRYVTTVMEPWPAVRFRATTGRQP